MTTPPTARGFSDDAATAVIDAVLALAVTVRDEVGPGVAEAARAVLAAAGGDPVAALTVAAALIRVDAPVDAWWQGTPEPARSPIMLEAARLEAARVYGSTVRDERWSA
jgi:hypothetical protein